LTDKYKFINSISFELPNSYVRSGDEFTWQGSDLDGGKETIRVYSLVDLVDKVQKYLMP
jgi:hypothetical protein